MVVLVPFVVLVVLDVFVSDERARMTPFGVTLVAITVHRIEAVTSQPGSISSTVAFFHFVNKVISYC